MNYFPLILSLCLIIVLVLRPTPKLFSQTAESEKKIEINDSKNPKLFNEGGYIKGFTTARVIGLGELLLALFSVVLAVRAKKSPSIPGARTALALGLIASLIAIAHVITTSGAVFGSGSGKAGSILALILALAGILLSGLTIRSHKAR